MFRIKPGKLLGTALFGAAVGFFQPASALTIDYSGGATSATLTCSGSDSTACMGYVGGAAHGFPDGTETLSATHADLFDIGSSGSTNELLAMNTISHESFSSATIVSFGETGTGTGIFSFFTTAEYILLKIGGGQTPAP